jgi:hypothetical protein
MPDANYFEVRCERCQTSFAPETKQCIHCGGPVGRRPIAFGARPRTAAAPADAGGDSAPADAQPSLGNVIRIAAIALVVLAAIVRACFESR